jgi:hypothetical protein
VASRSARTAADRCESSSAHAARHEGTVARRRIARISGGTERGSSGCSGAVLGHLRRRLIGYSPDLDHYFPRCAGCHRLHDRVPSRNSRPSKYWRSGPAMPQAVSHTANWRSSTASSTPRSAGSSANRRIGPTCPSSGDAGVRCPHRPERAAPRSRTRRMTDGSTPAAPTRRGPSRGRGPLRCSGHGRGERCPLHA